MTQLTEINNTPEKVAFREKVLLAQEGMKQQIANKSVATAECPLTHHFTPKDDKYGCHVYAREILLPKGSVVIGKIHRHQHLNIISKGKVVVYTEFGEKHLEAPITFVSEIGLKRSVYAVEDTLWTTIHLTEFVGEENLDKIEKEVISPDYQEMGLIDSVDELKKIENEGV